MNDTSYYSAINNWIAQYNGLVLAWFKVDMDEIGRNLPVEKLNNMLLAGDITVESVQDRKLLFASHYPLHTKEVDLCEKLGLNKMVVYSSMDSALFQRFGADKIKVMMGSMGMKNNESINHFMLTKAIEHIQEKIAAKVIEELPSTSAEEWLKLNMPYEQKENNK